MPIGFRGMGKLMVEKRRIELLIVLPATLRLWIPVSLARQRKESMGNAQKRQAKGRSLAWKKRIPKNRISRFFV